MNRNLRSVTSALLLTGALTAAHGQRFMPAGPDAAAAEKTAAMTSKVERLWPAGVVQQVGHPGAWGYEEGVLLDGIAAEWHATAGAGDFAYLKAAVDRYVKADGSITMDGPTEAAKPYPESAHTLDDIEMGRAVLLVYRATGDERYSKAAKYLRDQLTAQPKTQSGGFWHKQIYPNQMWLDGAYMAGPFLAAYGATFQEPAAFDEVARQLLLMDTHMRDDKTGLLRHGWDESHQMPWADKSTGLSPEAWARADGWYAMALVDVLDWIPAGHPQRPALIAALTRTIGAVVRSQDPATGLWWQVMDKGTQPGNYLEASASCMFVYAIAKSVRMGYIPEQTEASARRGWEGIQKQFITQASDGPVFSGTVKVGGLGGKPYRSGDYAYYIGEKPQNDDPKGVGSYLKAGAEMQQAATQSLGQHKTVLMDAWFNSQTRKNAAGQTELFHYKWDDDRDSGFSFVGDAFQRYGANLKQETRAPNAPDLSHAQIYMIVSPDTLAKNPTPHFMDKASGDIIETWVKNGGVLILFSNDKDNGEFEHFDTLADRFGIHFNPVLSHHVVEPDHTPGEVVIPSDTGIFGNGFKAYMKDTSTISLSGPAKAAVTDHGDVMIAVSKVGRGTVMGIVDPWIYNEYVNGRKMREYNGYESAVDLAAWAVKAAP